ncbi:MAG TPA: glycosidase [Armatimonadota bacterium]|nr:glycosidase [Armatimonadota bacterium]
MSQNDKQIHQREIFKRSEHNPIITFQEMPYPCNTVFNPGAAEVGGETLLLLRVEDLEGRSHLTVARSADGITGWRIERTPLLSPEDENNPHEEYGCEDPRLTYLADMGKWVIAYTAYSPFGAGVALALTEDFESVERLGLVLAPNNKDASLFPRKINGKYWMLHRPVAGNIEHIWLTESHNLLHWGRPWMVLGERGGPWWDGHKVGANTIPIETEKGWLILYHGVKSFPAGPAYRMGAALLDLEDPRRLISRLPYWILGAHEGYEMSGEVPNVVFACGHVQKGDDLYVYYGAADTSVCLATARISEILDALLGEAI